MIPSYRQNMGQIYLTEANSLDNPHFTPHGRAEKTSRLSSFILTSVRPVNARFLVIHGEPCLSLKTPSFTCNVSEEFVYCIAERQIFMS